MNREILFRGKTKDGEWVHGSYINIDTEGDEEGCSYIYAKSKISMFITPNEVIPETVGQFTGLTDKNGKKIFEGDVVSVDREDDFAQIVYDSENAKFILDFEDVVIDFDSFYNYEIEVIGNVYDNPELLKEGESNE